MDRNMDTVEQGLARTIHVMTRAIEQMSKNINAQAELGKRTLDRQLALQLRIEALEAKVDSLWSDRRP